MAECWFTGVLLIHVYLHIGLSQVKCATVTVDDMTGLLGDNQLEILCSFTLASGESAQQMVLSRRRPNEPALVDIATYNIAGNQSFYVEAALQDRSTLMIRPSSASIIFNSIKCNDDGTYQCKLNYASGSELNSEQDDMILVIQAQPTPPTIPAEYNPNRRTFVEGEELEVRCQAEVGAPAGDFRWFGYRGSNAIDLSSYAVSSPPSEVQGPQYCVFNRESVLRINLTRVDNEVVIRCVVDQVTLGDAPQPGDQCEADRCVQSDRIVVEYPIRQEDLQISSNPAQQEYIVGSTVNLKCTVDGNPDPSFIWRKDGDDSVGVEGEDTWVLSNLELGDTGVYRCLANNTLNGVTFNATKAININVVATTTPARTTQPPTTTTPKDNWGRTDPVTGGGSGVSGTTTTHTTGSTDNMEGCNKSANLSFASGVGLGFGIMLLIVVVAAVLVFISRRRVGAFLAGSQGPTNPDRTTTDLGFDNIQPTSEQPRRPQGICYL